MTAIVSTETVKERERETKIMSECCLGETSGQEWKDFKNINYLTESQLYSNLILLLSSNLITCLPQT